MNAAGLSRADARLAVLGAAGVALASLLAARVAGPAGLVLPLAVVVVLASLVRPVPLAVGVLSLVIAFEVGPGTLLGNSQRLYDPIAKTLSPFEAGLGVVALSILLDAHARRLPVRVAGPFNAGLVLLGLAMLQGVVVGHDAGASIKTLLGPVRILALLVVVPFVVNNLLARAPSLRPALLLACALAIFKGLVGLAGIATGHGAASVEGSRITYYEPAANLLMLLVLLLVLAVALRREAKLPLWVNAGSVLCFAALLLSFRRSFWIAAVAGFALVIVLGSGPTLRRMLLPLVLVLGFAIYSLLSGGLVTESQSPVAQRVTSLRPGKLSANAEDRYRLDERRNVIAEIRDHPVTGLGLSVPWAARYPLSLEQPAGRNYTHVIVLWYWLKLGILGVLAYLALTLTAIVTGVRVFLRHPDALVRAAGLAGAAGIVGFVLVEMTASFTGIDSRLTVVLGCLYGLLAAALAQTREAPVREVVG